jgi:hypothetical protein
MNSPAKSHGVFLSESTASLTKVFGAPSGALTWELETPESDLFWIMPCPGQDLSDPRLDFDLISETPETALEALGLIITLIKKD